MRASPLIAALGLGATLALGAPSADAPVESRSLSEAERILLDLNAQATGALEESGGLDRRAKGCSIFNASVRRDWALMTKPERRDYIKAAKCLYNAPSLLHQKDPVTYPGLRSRYDDFVAVHLEQTLTIHGTGNFLTWHRYYVWSYEQALRNECGYKGYQPYWNWFAHVDDPTKSPVFDGSDTSLSGNGDFFEHNGTLTAIGFIHIPSGAGGGCVTSGPFADVRINIGPVFPEMDTMVPNPGGPMAPNPRCLRRDLSSFVLSNWMTAANLLNVTVGDASKSIGAMQTELQGRFPDGFLGMHASGHAAVGGEASDIFTSPNDPSFFLHHAMVDRVYWIWQVLHPKEAKEIAGTITINNNPPSRDALKNDTLEMGPNAVTRPIEQLLDTLGGTPLCYVYL